MDGYFVSINPYVKEVPDRTKIWIPLGSDEDHEVLLRFKIVYFDFTVQSQLISDNS